jgi:hypothetical protein
MSATTHHHHHTIEAGMRSDYNPREIPDLVIEAKSIREEILYLQRLWYDATTRRIFGHYPFRYPNGRDRLACDIQREIEDAQTRLDILCAELDRRRI